jgi:hypothetical protein
MKKILICLSFVCTFLSCKKAYFTNDFDNFDIGSYLKLESSDKTTLDYNKISTESVSITVSPIGSELDKVNVYAVVGGENLDKTKWKLIKSFSAAGSSPIALDVSAQELATGLGVGLSDLNPGNQFTFYNQNITKDGRTFDVTNTDDDLEGQPGYQSSFRWQAIVFCAYDPASTNNVIYEVVVDEWGDFGAGDLITVKNGPGSNQIILEGVFATTINHKDLVVDISPANGAATVAKQAYGTYTFDPRTIQAEGNGFIFSCAGIINLNLRHSATDGSNFGAAILTLKKH